MRFDRREEAVIRRAVVTRLVCQETERLHRRGDDFFVDDSPILEESAKLLQVLNVSSYMVWQMVTIVNADCDHGMRNYCTCARAPADLSRPAQPIEIRMLSQTSTEQRLRSPGR